MRIWDCHVHCRGDDKGEDVLRAMDEAGIPDACEAALRSSSMKGNPIDLTRQEVSDILKKAL